MFKILILSNNDTGMWLFRRELLERLVADGHKVYLSVPEGDDVAKIRELGVKVTTALSLNRRGKNPAQDLRLLHDYGQLMSHIAPDVVLTYTIKPNVYGGIAARRRGIPVIANVTGLGDAIERGGMLARLTLVMYKEGLKGASCVFFQNKDNKERFEREGIVSGKTRLISGSGVNLSHYAPLPFPDGATIRFLYAGRILKDKGIDELIGAMRGLRAGEAAEESAGTARTGCCQNPAIHLDIAGYCDEDYEETLRAAEEEGLLTYHGMVGDLRPLYQEAHAVVMPSYHEGMNNVLQEAAASARPVLASDISGCKEIVDDSVTGLLFAPRSTQALQDAIGRFLALSREEMRLMGEAGRKKMEKEFDRASVIEAYLEEINTSIRRSM